MPKQPETSSTTTLRMQQLCKVCGEVAAGFHFGAFTCEGCKSFFGRMCKTIDKVSKESMSREEPSAIPEPKTPLPDCKTRGRCNVLGRGRTTCKRCRWDKCVQAKMSRLHSRYGRRSHYFKVACLIEAQDKARRTNGQQYRNATMGDKLQSTTESMSNHLSNTVYKPLAIIPPSYNSFDRLFHSPWHYSPPKLSPFWTDTQSMLALSKSTVFTPFVPFSQSAVTVDCSSGSIKSEQGEPLDLSVKTQVKAEPLDLCIK